LRSTDLRDEHRYRVFNELSVRPIVGSKRRSNWMEEVRDKNEQFQNAYSSPDISTEIKSRRIQWEGHVACKGEMIIA
jgi:hypothetical protein